MSHTVFTKLSSSHVHIYTSTKKWNYHNCSYLPLFITAEKVHKYFQATKKNIKTKMHYLASSPTHISENNFQPRSTTSFFLFFTKITIKKFLLGVSQKGFCLAITEIFFFKEAFQYC